MRAKVTATRPELWKALCAMAIKALVPAATPAPAHPEPPAGRFSLDGFLALLAATGLIDIGSQVGPSSVDRDRSTQGAP